MPVRDPAGEGEASREGELTHSSRKWWLEWSPPSAAPGSGTWHLHPTSSARDDVDREAAMRGNSIDPHGYNARVHARLDWGGRAASRGCTKQRERMPPTQQYPQARADAGSRAGCAPAGPHPFTAVPSVLSATRPKTSTQNRVSEFQERGSAFQAKLCRRRLRRA